MTATPSPLDEIEANLGSFIKRQDMQWRPHYINNIPSNPIDCYYCIIDFGQGTGRLYRIQPQYPTSEAEGFRIQEDQDPELYIVFESNVHRGTAEELAAHSYGAFDGYLPDTEHFCRACHSFDEAVARAWFSYYMVFGYAASHIPGALDKARTDHFVVGP